MTADARSGGAAEVLLLVAGTRATAAGDGPETSCGSRGLRLRVGGLGRGIRPCGQQVRRGKRSRASRKMAWSGQVLGRCSMTRVFSATTRVASLTSRRRKVSNWATRQVERFGIKLRKD